MALAGIALCAAGNANAQTLPQNISPDLRYASACFSRTYPDTHLRARPRQATVRIVLAALDRPAGQVTLPPDTSEMLIAIQTRNSRAWKARLAYCRFSPGSGPRSCQIESDGGSFVLSDRPDGTIMIRTSGEIRLGDEEPSVEIGGRMTDDNAFILHQAGCRRAPAN